MRVFFGCLSLYSCVLSIVAEVAIETETHGNTGLITKNIDGSDIKLKRQNGNTEPVGGGEEVDLSTIPIPGQGGVANPQQPGAQQPGQNPFFGNPYFGGQPPFFNGFGYPGGQYPGAFPQGFPQGFPNTYPQVGGQGTRNIILQNNGKQYLVQPLTSNQRVVEKNGKQYLLQPFTPNNAIGGSAATFNGLQSFNVPNSVLAGLNPFPQNAGLSGVNPAGFAQNGALNSINSQISAGNPSLNQIQGLGGNPFNTFSPAVSAVQPGVFGSNARETSIRAPQQRLAYSNGRAVEYEQIPIQTGGSSPYLSTAVAGVAAQLASQANGQQYAQYAPQAYQGIANTYARANAAGFGSYPVGRSDENLNEPVKRDTT